MGQRGLGQCSGDLQHIRYVLRAPKFQGPLVLDSEAGLYASQLQRTLRRVRWTLCLKQRCCLLGNMKIIASVPSVSRPEESSLGPPILVHPGAW